MAKVGSIGSLVELTSEDKIIKSCKVFYKPCPSFCAIGFAQLKHFSSDNVFQSQSGEAFLSFSILEAHF